MRYLVGRAGAMHGVFVVSGDKASFIAPATSGIGTDLSALTEGRVTADDLQSALASAPSVPVADITPDMPLARPGKIICLGLNYVDHIKEGGYDIPEYPALFMRGLNSMMAAGAPMIRPSCSERLDYEVELMVIIGKRGKHIAQGDAYDHIFGYTVFNDGSVRDYQRKTHQWTPGKNFDNTGAIGPFVVTPDEVPEGASGLKIESRVGSEILQSSNTSNMIWPAARSIAIISEYTTLEPGDLIALGTPPGVGHAKKPNPRWLRPGETVEIEIEGIGVCASPVVDEAAMTVAAQ